MAETDSTVEKESPAPILILGAGRNIGLAVAKRFVESGRRVVLSFRSSPDEAVGLRMEHPELVLGVFPLDATTPSATVRFFRRVGETTDRLSAVVNAIGPFAEKALLESSDDEFEMLLQGNLVQAFSTARLSLPFFARNGGGRLVFFTFAGVEKIAAYSKIGAYAAAKTGLLSLVRSLAAELSSMNVTVNAIAPGVVESAPAEHKELLGGVPGGRIVSFDDIFSAIDFLLSAKADHITGTNLLISGGFGLR